MNTDEYQKGFNRGYNDSKRIPYFLLREPSYTAEFIRGYYDGVKQIDQEIDAADQARSGL
jgi:hypothetical protein